MIKFVNSVLVGKIQPAAVPEISNAVAGDIVMQDAETGLSITSTADAAKAKTIKIGCVSKNKMSYADPTGVAKEISQIQWSNGIDKQTVRSYKPFEHQYSSEDKISIDFDAFVPVIGHRYVLRLVYRDIYEHPGQFTHSYEVIATTNVLADLISAFMARVNGHAGTRVIATSAGNILTMVAKPRTDVGGLNSINLFARVSVQAFMWYTDPAGLGHTARNKYTLPGVEIVHTPGTNGMGNPYIIRDRENYAQAYRGITYRTHFPVIQPDLNVDITKRYSGAVLEFENQHRTANDDYQQTKQTVELYVEGISGYIGSELDKLIVAFVTGVA